MTFISDLSTVSSNLKINLSEKAISNPFENIEYFQCLEQAVVLLKILGGYQII